MTDFMNGFLRRFFPSGPTEPEETYPPVPKRPSMGAVERTALNAAQRWLDTATRTHVRSFALGEERTFGVDQGTGMLSLVYADDQKVNLPIQIIASFRPQDGSFRWSWANTSFAGNLQAAAIKARDDASTQGFVSFRTPTFEADFEDSTQLAACAAKLAGCDGVYRCLTGRGLTAFVGYRAPASEAPPPSELESQAVALVDAYDRDMFPIDVEAQRKGAQLTEEHGLMDRLLAQKQEVYSRYWRRDDDYWEPNSFGWPSEHDPKKRAWRFAAPRRAGGVYVLSQTGRFSHTAHVVESVQGELRITDLDEDWGTGLLLPRKALAG